MIEKDPEYDFIEPIGEALTKSLKRGSQCGQCGAKFEYGKFYSYCCPHPDCPTGFNTRWRDK